MKNFLFLSACTREPGHVGNTETLARRAAASLVPEVTQTWLPLAALDIPPFIDRRHTTGTYPMPEGDLKRVLDAQLAATDIVLVSPVYWYSPPGSLKQIIDHWSAWMRVPGVNFKARMAEKRLWVVSTSGDRAKAQPMIDSYRLCAEFLGMEWKGALWGLGGTPDAVLEDVEALAAAECFFHAG